MQNLVLSPGSWWVVSDMAGVPPSISSITVALQPFLRAFAIYTVDFSTCVDLTGTKNEHVFWAYPHLGEEAMPERPRSQNSASCRQFRWFAQSSSLSSYSKAIRLCVPSFRRFFCWWAVLILTDCSVLWDTRLDIRKRFCTRMWWTWNRLPRAMVTEPTCWSSRGVWTMLSNITAFECWVVLCGGRSWTRWSSWVPSKLGYPVSLWNKFPDIQKKEGSQSLSLFTSKENASGFAFKQFKTGKKIQVGKFCG